MTQCEKCFARLSCEQDGTQVAEIVRRNTSSIWELLGLEEDLERPGAGRNGNNNANVNNSSSSPGV